MRIKAFLALPLEIRHAADSRLISHRALLPVSKDTFAHVGWNMNMLIDAK